MRIGILFPGQGSQHAAMLESYQGSEYYAAIQTALEHASVLTQVPFLDLLRDQSASINETIVTQPLLLSHSLAVWSLLAPLLSKHNIVLGGHSLGELTAAAAAGLLSVEQGISVAQQRAHFMQAAMPQSPIGMSVVLGALTVEEIESVLEDYESVWLVNDNCPGQVVLGGLSDPLMLATEKLKAIGAKRIVQLPMSVVSHCSLLEPALVPFQKVLNQSFKQQELYYPIASNWTTTCSQQADEVIDRLAQQLTHRVRFREMIVALAPEVDCFIEVGAGQVLTQLIKKTVATPCYPTHNADQLQSVLTLLRGE